MNEDESRHLICQMAVELPLQDIVDTAVAAGWKETEILSAMIAVADNLMLASGEISALNDILGELKRRRDDHSDSL